MKKYFSLASALMLALSMGMTSCSNDLDEVQAPVEQQAELHKLHLSASAPQSSETRTYIEGVAGSDAIKITGWKEGDVIWGVYPVGDINAWSATVGFLPFEFNATTKEFDSNFTSVNKEDIKYFITGNLDIENISSPAWYPDYDNSFFVYLKDKFVNIDVEHNSCDIPMFGTASVADDQLKTSMNLADGMAFVCLHNNSTASIDVTLVHKYSFSSGLSYIGGNRLKFSTTGKFVLWSIEEDDVPTAAAVTTIDAGAKAYLPLFTGNDRTVKIVVDGDYEHPFAESVETSFTPGKIYNLIYTGA